MYMSTFKFCLYNLSLVVDVFKEKCTQLLPWMKLNPISRFWLFLSDCRWQWHGQVAILPMRLHHLSGGAHKDKSKSFLLQAPLLLVATPCVVSNFHTISCKIKGHILKFIWNIGIYFLDKIRMFNSSYVVHLHLVFQCSKEKCGWCFHFPWNPIKALTSLFVLMVFMSGPPARTVGWRDPGFIHTSFLWELWPNFM